MAWSKRRGAGAAFRGGLLICDDGSVEGAEEPLPAYVGSFVRAFVVCERPRLAMALAVRRFFAQLMVDRPARFHSTEQREQAEAMGAWVRNAAFAPGVTFGVHCSVGSSGMGFERRDDGTLVGFPQIGSVVVEADVDIAAYATVQRGAIGATRVCRGAKIGPHVIVGHNVEVGRNVLIAGHAQIGGGAKIGAGAVLWQSCAIANGVTVGEGAVIGMGAQVLKDVPAGETWVGNPARPLKKR
jgi:UDP-3-O-[3-hydroxymyristoyl] glucosamine N-acyltransferase